MFDTRTHSQPRHDVQARPKRIHRDPARPLHKLRMPAPARLRTDVLPERVHDPDGEVRHARRFHEHLLERDAVVRARQRFLRRGARRRELRGEERLGEELCEERACRGFEQCKIHRLRAVSRVRPLE
jgi:hypothetical protein